jgi:hypothetical protein
MTLDDIAWFIKYSFANPDNSINKYLYNACGNPTKSIHSGFLYSRKCLEKTDWTSERVTMEMSEGFIEKK